MTHQAVHVFIGDGPSIIGHSVISRERAEEQAQEHYKQLHGPQPKEGNRRPIVLYAKADKPQAIEATRNIATLTADTIYRLMEQGHITHHAGVTL